MFIKGQAATSEHLLSPGICELHIQDGHVWRPIDALTWYAEIADPLQGEVPKTISESQDASGEGNGNDIEIHPAVMSRSLNPTRFRAARADAEVGTIKRTIEEIFGLPEGSVALCDRQGNPLRADAKIATLRKRWE